MWEWFQVGCKEKENRPSLPATLTPSLSTTTALENRSGRTNFIVSGEKKTSHGPQRDDTPALSVTLPSRPPTDTKYVKKGCHNRWNTRIFVHPLPIYYRRLIKAIYLYLCVFSSGRLRIELISTPYRHNFMFFNMNCAWLDAYFEKRPRFACTSTLTWFSQCV